MTASQPLVSGFGFWDHAQREQIADAAFALLQDVGGRIDSAEARQLLGDAGAAVDGKQVRIPVSLVTQALASAPTAVDIFDRLGQLAFRLDAQAVVFGAHVDGPDMLDPISGQRRPCVEADAVDHSRLIDACPNISFLTVSGMLRDHPAQVGDRVSLARSLQNSTKPVLTMPITLEGLQDAHDLAALAVGGREALRAYPHIIAYSEPVSPLLHPDDVMRKVGYCAREGIPCVYSGFAAMGGTAPMSPTGAVVQLIAETLTGLVVHQLAAPGAPFLLGGMPSLMDMRTTTFSYGAPEFIRGNTLMVEMAHHFGLPCMGTAGTSDAHVMDGQAIAEASASVLMALLSRGCLVHDVGLLGNATVVIPEMITATDALVGMLRRLLTTVPSDSEAVAADVIAEVGPGGAFLDQAHTLAHFREVAYDPLFYRGGAARWEQWETPSFEDRVRDRTRDLIRYHTPTPLAEDRAAAMEAVLRQEQRG
jgi:trimethylamine---corrinoid protein Co-methyltransferase